MKKLRMFLGITGAFLLVLFLIFVLSGTNDGQFTGVNPISCTIFIVVDDAPSIEGDAARMRETMRNAGAIVVYGATYDPYKSWEIRMIISVTSDYYGSPRGTAFYQMFLYAPARNLDDLLDQIGRAVWVSPGTSIRVDMSRGGGQVLGAQSFTEFQAFANAWKRDNL